MCVPPYKYRKILEMLPKWMNLCEIIGAGLAAIVLDGQSITQFNIAPLFQNGAKHLDLRCVLLQARGGAGCKTQLESSMKEII